MDAVFTVCIRPDCQNKHPRFCSLACARDMEGKGDAVDKLEDALTAVNMDLGTACRLLLRAADALTVYELTQAGFAGQASARPTILRDIGAFLARVRP